MLLKQLLVRVICEMLGEFHATDASLHLSVFSLLVMDMNGRLFEKFSVIVAPKKS